MRAYVFFDGQNLFYSAKDAFGYTWPNYDPHCLAKAVCERQGWELARVFFYTGLPDRKQAPFWHGFWSRKLAVIGSRGVGVYSRPLRYRQQSVELPNGQKVSTWVTQEKGIDVRLALDVVRNCRDYDVAVIFSQDQDLVEAVEEARRHAVELGRKIEIYSAFPDSPKAHKHNGVNGTLWLPLSKDFYDTCLDHNDYRDKGIRKGE